VAVVVGPQQLLLLLLLPHIGERADNRTREGCDHQACAELAADIA